MEANVHERRAIGAGDGRGSVFKSWLRVYAKALRHERPRTGFVRAPLSRCCSTASVDCPPQVAPVEGLANTSKTRAQKYRNEGRLGLRSSRAVGVQEVGSSNLLGPTISRLSKSQGIRRVP